MPRASGSSAGAAGSAGGSHPSFRGAEQSLKIMRQVKSYFNVGMDHVLEVATDMADYGLGKGHEEQMAKLREMMLSYISMEQDINIFMNAAENVMAQGDECEEEGGLESMLQEQVKQKTQPSNTSILKTHEKYTELEQKLWDCQHPDAVPSSLGAGTVPLVEDDIEMTQEHINTKCPYTGKEMTEPMRNVICKHTYDKAGITQYVKHRGKKALCPVGACKNSKPIVMKDLEDHKEMRRYINSRKRPQTLSALIPGTSRD